MTDEKQSPIDKINEQTEKGKSEPTFEQDYFYWNSDEKLLIDGIPMSQFFDMQERKMRD